MKKVVNNYFQTNKPETLRLQKHRYTKMKKAGSAILRQSAADRTVERPLRIKVGRNEPLPVRQRQKI
jgi:hypothetical protein